MSAEIIQFIRGPRRDRELSDFPTIAFRLAPRHVDPVVDYADTAPCEYIRPEEPEPAE